MSSKHNTTHNDGEQYTKAMNHNKNIQSLTESNKKTIYIYIYIYIYIFSVIQNNQKPLRTHSFVFKFLKKHKMQSILNLGILVDGENVGSNLS